MQAHDGQRDRQPSSVPPAKRHVALAASLGGPILIVGLVVVLLWAIAFGSRLTTFDVLRYFMPMYCAMGKSLAAGHIPLWNPSVAGGMPFAADPQSGWMNLSAMTLFAALPCGLAIRWMVVLQPILGGLAIYAFLRSEQVSRPAATTAGLGASAGIAGAELVLSLPFSGALAWTATTLAACSRYVKASTWASRIVWCLAVAAGWGQIAAAHFSVGFLIGSLAVVAYILQVLWSNVFDEHWTARRAAAIGGVLFLAVVAVNLAVVLPRLAYVPETNLGLGYAGLDQLADRIVAAPVGPVAIGPSTGPEWPLKLASTPGAHLGALILGLSFLGWRSRVRRPFVAAFSGFAFLCYVLSLRVVAEATPGSFRSFRVVQFYLHSPEWFGYGLLIAIPVLGGLGLEAFRETGPAGSRILWLIPGVIAWGALPWLFGAGFTDLWPLLLGTILGGTALILVPRRNAAAILIPAVLAVELGVAATRHGPAGQWYGPGPRLLIGAPQATVDPQTYADDPGPLLEPVRRDPHGRVLTVADVSGMSRRQQTRFRVLTPDLAMLYRIEDVAVFNPVQLLRYWVFARASQRTRILYNRSAFTRPTQTVLDLFQVGWVIVRADTSVPVANASRVSGDSTWDLYRLPDQPPRASVILSWKAVPAGPAFPNEALDRMLQPGFDSERQVVLERDPGIPTAATGELTPARADYQATDGQSAQVTVEVAMPAIVLVRNVYADGWRATVDGRPAPVLRANYLFQAVPVSAGRHTIRLFYRDRWIGIGLLGSGLSVLCLVAMAGAALRRERGGGSS
jgi:hypothetical protein